MLIHPTRWLVLIGAIAALALAQERTGTTQPKPKPTVAQLIEQLDSEDFPTREAATETLKEREDAVPALRRALGTGSPEVRRRAEQILQVLEAREARQGLKRVVAHAKNGEVDQVVDLMVALEDALDIDTWRAAMLMVRRVTEKANQRKGYYYGWAVTDPLTCLKDPCRFGKIGTEEEIRDLRAVVPVLTKRRAILGCDLISQGSVQCDQYIAGSILISNGDIKASWPLKSNILICDGTIEAKGAEHCLLIATGAIKLTEQSDDCLVIENAREALGVIKFYDPRQAGLELAEDGGAVVVRRVLDGKPFASSGIRARDRIVAVDHAKVESLDAFRRVLRRKSVLHQETLITVERANHQTSDIRVPLTD